MQALLMETPHAEWTQLPQPVVMGHYGEYLETEKTQLTLRLVNTNSVTDNRYASANFPLGWEYLACGIWTGVIPFVSHIPSRPIRPPGVKKSAVSEM